MSRTLINVIEDVMIQTLEGFRNGIMVELAEELAVNDYRNKAFDEAVSVAEACVMHIDMIDEYMDAPEPSSGEMTRRIRDAVTKGITYTLVGFKDLMDELTDKQYDSAVADYALIEHIMTDVEEGEISQEFIDDIESRGRRGRRDRTRDSRRSNRGRDNRNRGRVDIDYSTGDDESRSSRRNRRTRRERDDYEDSRSYDGRRSRAIMPEPNPDSDDPRDRSSRRAEPNKRKTRRVERATVSYGDSKVTTNSEHSARQTRTTNTQRAERTGRTERVGRTGRPTSATNARRAEPVEKIVMDKVTVEPTWRTGELKSVSMESYEQHELGMNPCNRNKDGGKVIPNVNFRRFDKVETKAEIENSLSVKVNPELSIVEGSFEPDMSRYQKDLSSDFDFTVTQVHNRYTLGLPRAIAEQFKDAISTARSYDDWHQLLVRLNNVMSKETNYRGLLSTFIAVVDNRLRHLLNSMLAVHVNKDCCVESFFEDYNECRAYLSSSEMSHITEDWIADMKKTLTAGMEVVDVKNSTDDDKYSAVVFMVHFLNVSSRGELPQEGMLFTVRNAVADVDFDELPEFFTACKNMVDHRNSNQGRGQIILSDEFNNRFAILAGNEGASRIHAMYLE